MYKGIPLRGQRWLWCVQELSCKGKWNMRTSKSCKSSDCKIITFYWDLIHLWIYLSSLFLCLSVCVWCVSLSVYILCLSLLPYIITLNFLPLFYFDDLQETAEQCCTLSTGVRNHFESIQIIKGYKKCKSGHRQSLVSLVRYVYRHHHHHHHYHHQSPS